MGFTICEDLSLSSLTICLTPLRMVFLPRLPLLMFITFLGDCSNTHVKADGTKSCDSVQKCFMDSSTLFKSCMKSCESALAECVNKNMSDGNVTECNQHFDKCVKDCSTSLDSGF